MESVTGIFATREAAERAYAQVRQAGIPDDQLTILTPGSADQIGKEIQAVPTDTTEPPAPML